MKELEKVRRRNRHGPKISVEPLLLSSDRYLFSLLATSEWRRKLNPRGTEEIETMTRTRAKGSPKRLPEEI